MTEPTTTDAAAANDLTVTELIVDMSCGKCQQRVSDALTPLAGVDKVDINLEQKRVLVTGTAATSALVDAVSATGKQVAVAGKSSANVTANASFLSAVAQFTHDTIKGLVRFTDLPQRRALIEIDFDGLAPGNKHAVGVHRTGDVGGIDCSRCGPLLESGGELAIVTADANGRARVKLEAPLISVDNIIGRSVVVRDAAAAASEADRRLACAVVARSAGVQQNVKRICACDGTTIWESKA